MVYAQTHKITWVSVAYDADNVPIGVFLLVTVIGEWLVSVTRMIGW